MPDLARGDIFPDLELPEHTGEELSLGDIADGQPLVVCFLRGWWCPKEQIRARTLVSMQEEIQREYGALVAITVDSPYVNGTFRAGIGASFPFLSDEDRRIARELDLLEITDRKHLPYLPFTFVLDSNRRIHESWCGFWYWGNPTPEELRQALREITKAEQPTFGDPRPVWRAGGAASAEEGIAADAIWIREDVDGNEIQRGVFSGEVPETGQEISRSAVDGRPWIVRAVERENGRVALHLRKGGEPDTSPLVRHHITVPPATST